MVPNTFSGVGSLSGLGSLSAPATVYTIGQTGPGGGIVFYDEGSVQSWGRYLEAATSATSPSWTDTNAQWRSGFNTNVTGTSTSIGTGRANTLLMGSIPAATLCKNFTGGGKTDWFLPSYDELNQLYLQRATVGGFFSASSYWSSSQRQTNAAYGQFWGNGARTDYDKTENFRVRPIRAF